MKIKIICTEHNIESVLELFKISYLAVWERGKSKGCYYCGITNNLRRRKAEHNVDDNLAEVECDSFETARQLEQMLHDEGFDTGEQLGNGTTESVYVYMYKKIPQVTNESL